MKVLSVGFKSDISKVHTSNPERVFLINKNIIYLHLIPLVKYLNVFLNNEFVQYTF